MNKELTEALIILTLEAQKQDTYQEDLQILMVNLASH